MNLEDIRQARARIASQLLITPCTRCVWLEERVRGKAYLKLENQQYSGSFKDRGALNCLLTLSEEERSRGVIAASAGNHAQATALHARRLGMESTIGMPVTTPAIKVANTKRYGAEVILSGNTYDAAFDEAMRLAKECGKTYVHAFDDERIIAGQGTIGLELMEQLPPLTTVIVPVGGGGLLAGVATALKEVLPNVRIVGVQSALVPGMQAALEAGSPVTLPPAQTLADGIAVRKVSPRTLAVARKYMDELVTVDEEEIASAILFLLEREKTVAEGAGAVGVAALLAEKVRTTPGDTLAIIVGGGNIDVTMLGKIIDRGLVRDGRMVRFHIRIQDRPGGLAEVAGVFAELGANIVDIRHERAFTHTLYTDVDLTATLETQGQAHVEEIRTALEKIAKEVQEIV